MFRFYRICLCVSLVCFPSFVIAKPIAEIAKPIAEIAKPTAVRHSLDFENSLVKVFDFECIIQRVGGQVKVAKRTILDLYPKFKQQIMDTVNAQVSTHDPKLVDSLESAEKYFYTVFYPLLLSHLAVLKGSNSNLKVKELFTLPSILYRLNLLEVAIQSSQKFKNFNTYKSDLLSKINSKIEEVTLKLTEHPNNEKNLRDAPELNSAADLALTYVYQNMLKNVCSAEKNIELFLEMALKGDYIRRFGCQGKKGLSKNCLPVPMTLRLL